MKRKTIVTLLALSHNTLQYDMICIYESWTNKSSKLILKAIANRFIRTENVSTKERNARVGDY